CTPGKTGVARLRAADPAEADAMQAVWESSNAVDDPASWSRGGWSIGTWATDTRVLEMDSRVVGVVGVRAEPAPDGAMPARLALEVAERQPTQAGLLVAAAVDLIRAADGARVRLFVPSRANWMQAAAREVGFEPVRTIAHMQLPASTATPSAQLAAGLRVRSIRDGEDHAVLNVLNRNWAGTWNFVEITFAMLEEDLEDQRKGMLLAVDESDRVVATCHAVYDPSEQNP